MNVSDNVKNTKLSKSAYMVKNSLFNLISASDEGVPVETVAARLFNFSSGPSGTMFTLMIRVIGDDKRYFITPDRKLKLTETGLNYKEMLDRTFVIVDLETTGTRTFKDKITEIGAFKVRGGEIIDSYASLVNPGRYIPYNITKITGITNEMVNDAPGIAEIITKFLAFLGDDVFVAHNAPFDFRFINAALIDLGYDQLRNPVLCTCKTARCVYPGFKKYDLGTLSKRLGVINKSRHRAAGDAAATAEILINMLYDMQNDRLSSLLTYS